MEDHEKDQAWLSHCGAIACGQGKSKTTGHEAFFMQMLTPAGAAQSQRSANHQGFSLHKPGPERPLMASLLS